MLRTLEIGSIKKWWRYGIDLKYHGITKYHDVYSEFHYYTHYGFPATSKPQKGIH